MSPICIALARIDCIYYSRVAAYSNVDFGRVNFLKYSRLYQFFFTFRLRSVSSDWTFRKLSRVSAPGGILASGFSNLQDVDTSTDENEFQYEDELNEVVNETDV